MITILNTSIITAYGSYSYKPCSLDRAKKVVASDFQSAVGHESTAAVISTLLGVEVKMNRIPYHQRAGDTALVFKLLGRPPEGKILTAEEIEEIGYEWGLLERMYVYDYELPTKTKILRYIERSCWWTMDYLIMPVICLSLLVGLVVSAAVGLDKLFSM
jgi:hypothetical protein